MKNICQKIRYALYIIIFLGFLGFYLLLVNPIFFGVTKQSLEYSADPELLRQHVAFMTDLEKQRTHTNLDSLNAVADYIHNSFTEASCDEVSFQKFTANDNEYKNVICRFTGQEKELIVVGAHYDVDAEHTHDKHEDASLYKGADDNASGVAGVLELARLIGNNKTQLKNDVELVAYTLEELPFFRTEKMGSYIHAASLNDEKREVKYMVSLEMIGYFTDEKVQKYPIRFLSWFYPKKGNYIAIIGELFDFEIRNFKENMIRFSDIDTRSLSSPKFITGVDFSDHRNYWNFGYRAYMVTDTAFYRNQNYHTINDTIDTLDFEKMKEVVNGVYGHILYE